METESRTRTLRILMIMNIVAWGAFIGLAIETGAILVSYIVSCFNPEGARNLYEGLDLHTLREFSFGHYTLSVFFRIALSAMKSFMCYLVIKSLSTVDLVSPFSADMARLIARISYVLFTIAIVAIMNSEHANWLSHTMGTPAGDQDAGAFLFAAGLVFILSQLFKRGVEMQSENDLTV